MRRLKRFGRQWNLLGADNACGAVLTGDAGAYSAWDLQEFLATGRADVARFMADLHRAAPRLRPRHALDFGCGVGRITRALAAHVEMAIGVDVAPSMIARAQSLSGDCSNCRFVVNRRPDLRQFPDDTFDVVYSRLVLQHIPPRLVRRFIPELVRVVAPGGVLMFQLPGEMAPEPEEAFCNAPVIGGAIKRHLPRTLVRAYRHIKYRLLIHEPAMLMFGMARDEVVALVQAAGGRILEIQPDESHGEGSAVPGYEYWITRASPASSASPASPASTAR